MFKLVSLLPNSVVQKLTAGYFRGIEKHIFSPKKFTTDLDIPVQTWRTVGFRGHHSSSICLDMESMTVELIPALQDNYMYLVSIIRYFLKPLLY